MNLQHRACVRAMRRVFVCRHLPQAPSERAGESRGCAGCVGSSAPPALRQCRPGGCRNCGGAGGPSSGALRRGRGDGSRDRRLGWALGARALALVGSRRIALGHRALKPVLLRTAACQSGRVHVRVWRGVLRAHYSCDPSSTCSCARTCPTGGCSCTRRPNSGPGSMELMPVAGASSTSSSANGIARNGSSGSTSSSCPRRRRRSRSRSRSRTRVSARHA
jgi:hypothetical protein